MTVKSAGTWSGLIVCKDATGALATPSVGPVGALYVDGLDASVAATVTGSNPYKWTCTLPALTAGQRVSMYITATIATIATASVVAEESADTYLPSDNYTALTNATYGLSALETLVDGIETDTAAILLDTGTDGVIVASHTTAAKAEIESEVDDALGAGTGTALTAIPWNALWDTEVQSECTDALTAYDPPTDTELDAAFLALQGADSDTLETLSDQLDAVDSDVWTYATRTLTVSPATATVGTTTTITCVRGDTMSQAVTGLGSISTRSKLWFTVKTRDEDADTAAIIQIEETAGLVYMNGAAAGTAANGSITVTNAVTGALTITLKPAETDDLKLGPARYDIQMLTTAGVVDTLASGIFDVTADQTRAIA